MDRIYVLENTHGVVETGTATEVTRAWLHHDGGDYRVEPNMVEAMKLDDEGEEIEGSEHEVQDGWLVEIKEHINARFSKAYYTVSGETQQEAEADFLTQAFGQINKSRSFTVMTKADYDEMQADIAAQQAADEANE